MNRVNSTFAVETQADGRIIPNHTVKPGSKPGKMEMRNKTQKLTKHGKTLQRCPDTAGCK